MEPLRPFAKNAEKRPFLPGVDLLAYAVEESRLGDHEVDPRERPELSVEHEVREPLEPVRDFQSLTGALERLVVSLLSALDFGQSITRLD